MTTLSVDPTCLPSLGDIRRLAHQHPEIYHSLMLHERGDLSLEQALMLSVALLAKSLKASRSLAEEWIVHSTMSLRHPSK